MFRDLARDAFFELGEGDLDYKSVTLSAVTSPSLTSNGIFLSYLILIGEHTY